MSSAKLISIGNIIANNKLSVAINVLLTTLEITLMSLVPLFIGFAIDGLLARQTDALLVLIAILIALVTMSVIRRFYDTRAYGDIRVNVQADIASTSQNLPVSVLNARIGMGRELVDFLEQSVPEALNASVQFIISLFVLYFLNPVLALAAFTGAILTITIYSLFHQGFYTLNRSYNKQAEQQVSTLDTKSPVQLFTHLSYLKKMEIKLSDREAILYGSVFIVLLAMVVFNLWFATSDGQISAGTIFSIVSYSWEFVEAAIILPVTLQSWTRLSEITVRINTKTDHVTS